jgi:hypothetical protein
MKISALECLHAAGGFRNLDFVKITTDEGLVGWSDLAYQADDGLLRLQNSRLSTLLQRPADSNRR